MSPDLTDPDVRSVVDAELEGLDLSGETVAEKVFEECFDGALECAGFRFTV